MIYIKLLLGRCLCAYYLTLNHRSTCRMRISQQYCNVAYTQSSCWEMTCSYVISLVIWFSINVYMMNLSDVDDTYQDVVMVHNLHIIAIVSNTFYCLDLVYIFHILSISICIFPWSSGWFCPWIVSCSAATTLTKNTWVIYFKKHLLTYWTIYY